MKQVFRSWPAATRGGGALMLLGALGAGSGCTDEETGLFIQGNVLIEPPGCIARAEGGGIMLLSGLLDVGLRLDYVATLLVGSQLTPRGDKENLRTETMITTITGAEVQLFLDTGELDTEFTVPASGVISPDSSSDPGFGIINATLIPQATGAELAESLQNRGEIRTRVAQVKVFGETVGGLEVESADLRYVIRVCEGCLVSFPTGAVDQNGVCSFQGDMNAEDPPCNFGQDDVVDCRLCAAFNPYCQSAAL